MDHEPHHLHDRGLAFDLATLMDRRRILGILAGVGAASLVGCTAPADQTAGGTPSVGTPSGSGPATPGGTATCEEIPAETAGPYPGDGSNGPDVLSRSGIVRRDIRSSFGSASGVAKGIPLTVTLTVLDVAKGCVPLPGAAVYLWHCDMEGRYSLYSPGGTDQNYLRGVQAADNAGVLSFTSIFPAAYPGRWPHIHFEVYPSLEKATSSSDKMVTSQLALPEDVSRAVYTTSGYEASVRNFAQTSLARDSVFRDGYSRQLETVTGSTSAGYVASLTVPV